MTSKLDQAPPRMYITHLKSGITINAQFNPIEVEEELSVTYNRLAILGHSGTPMQYLHTENQKVSFSMNFDAKSVRGVQPGQIDGPALVTADGTVGKGHGQTVEVARRFLLACCYPSAGASDVVTGAPSRLLFVWPKAYSVVAKLLRVRNKFTRWDISGRPSLMASDVEIEIDNVRRLTFEDVLGNGLMRDNASAEG